MQIFTQKELDDKAWAWLAEEDGAAVVREWFLVREGFNLWMVILYKRDGSKDVYALQKILIDFCK